MKKILMVVLFAISSAATAGNVVINGTRFVYPSNEKEITVDMNNTAPHPAVIQAWLDDGQEDASPDDLDIPFTISPPVSRIESKSGQSLRIRNINKSAFPTDRESLLYLNILEIPPVRASEKSTGNSLMMAIRSRFKFFYRPVGLGNADTAPTALALSAKGNVVAINNPTPFYITVVKIAKPNSKNIATSVVMIAPKSTSSVKLSSALAHGEKVSVGVVNDYGAISNFDFNIK